MLPRLLFAATAALLSAVAFAAQPIPKSDGPPTPKKGFVFPQVDPKTVPPAPTPPGPGVVPVLTSDTLYVIPSDEPFLLFDSPRGSVTVTREAGPIRIRGKFLDGTGKIETRNYSAKHLAIVEAAPGGKGRVELIAVPQGIADESGAARMLVDVNQAPQPPPSPDPKPDPTPDPAVKSFRVIWVYESATTNPNAANVMNAKAVRDYLNANCTRDDNWPGWREWDKDQKVTTDFPVFKDLWAAVQPKLTDIPCVVIEVNGKVSIEPFPKSVNDALATLRKFNGGK